MPETINHPKDWSLGTWMTALSTLLSGTVLAWAVWIGAEYGTFQQRMLNLDGRLMTLESRSMSPESARRVAVLEANQTSQSGEIRRLGDQLNARLDRIENKIDRQSEQ